MSKYHIPLLPDSSYHLFSRAIGNEKLFIEQKNYQFFLNKLKFHTHKVCDIYCYSLLPNHFHFLAKIKSGNDIIKEFETVKQKEFNILKDSLNEFVMERFSNLLNSYTKSFNKMYNRKGGLFMEIMKRSEVREESDFTNFIWYIHKNAVHHGLVKKIGEWKHDSYNSILSASPTSLLREEVIHWFGGKDRFVAFHDRNISFKREILDL